MELIINAIVESKYYAIMVDCTSDLSHAEQVSIIVRYVALCPNEKKYKIEERFLSFVTDLTGEGIKNTIVADQEKVLDLNDMRGQGYDNGPNVAGMIKGVQSLMLELNSRAFFVPSANHKINLMVNDTAILTENTFTFFKTVQKCIVFFCELPKHWAVSQDIIENEKITLKNVSTTRRLSREVAIKCLLLHLPKVHAAFCKIANVLKPDESSYDANNMFKISATSTLFVASLFGTMFYRK